MKNNSVILYWSGSLIPASDELTDHEIQERYGVLLRDAVSAFREDPDYVVIMAEAASRLKKRRENNRTVSL